MWRNRDEMLEKILGGRVEELLPRVPETELIGLLRASADRSDELLYPPNRDAHIRIWGKRLEYLSIAFFVTSSIRQSKLSLLVLKKWWAWSPPAFTIYFHSTRQCNFFDWQWRATYGRQMEYHSYRDCVFGAYSRKSCFLNHYPVIFSHLEFSLDYIIEKRLFLSSRRNWIRSSLLIFDNLKKVVLSNAGT